MDVILITDVIGAFAKREIKIDTNCSPVGIIIDAEDLLPVCSGLHQHPKTYFDMLSCVTGIDNGAPAKNMEVVYHLYSIPFNYSVLLKVHLPGSDPAIDSVTGIWKSANWLEREVYDMFGINFRNHPDLRRILMPNDWVGHPLRKDYQHADTYRDIVIKY